jgi:hypothetical protein
MRSILLSLVFLAALIGLSAVPASAATTAAGLHAVSNNTSVTNVDWRWGGHNWRHRRWRNHRWYYYN